MHLEVLLEDKRMQPRVVQSRLFKRCKEQNSWTDHQIDELVGKISRPLGFVLLVVCGVELAQLVAEPEQASLLLRTWTGLHASACNALGKVGGVWLAALRILTHAPFQLDKSRPLQTDESHLFWRGLYKDD